MILEILVFDFNATLQCCTINLMLTVDQKNRIPYYVKEISFYL